MKQTTKNNFRDGATMVETTLHVETQSAIVDYADILEHVEIESDYDYDPFDCDGLEHETTRARDVDNADERAGYIWDEANREHVVITCDPADVKKWGVYDYARARGASRQVAREMEALNLRRTIERIGEYISGNASGYVVSCEYMGEQASCGGVDDYDYATHSMAHEIAAEIVSGLEARGYTVENKPSGKPTKYSKRWRLLSNLNSQSWIERESFDYAADERETMGSN